MPKINVYLPDELAEAVKAAGVPVSAICQRALEQAVRRVTAIRETVITGANPGDPTEKLTHFSPRARQVVVLAVEQARAAGAGSVGTEHILGGILAEGGNLALQVLHVLEIDPAALRRELDAPATAAEAEQGSGIRFNGPAANALELSVSEAFSMGHNYIGCEHLLLGLIAEPDGTGGHVLRSLGAEYRLTRRAVTAALAGYVHLRAQTSAATKPVDPTAALAAAIQRELAPILDRLTRLEERIDPQ